MRAADLVTVLRSDGRYDARRVERLARGARRFASGFDRIVCVTNSPVAISGVE